MTSKPKLSREQLERLLAVNIGQDQPIVFHLATRQYIVEKVWKALNEN